MALSRGRPKISFRSVEQLAESMLQLARTLEAEEDAFARAYEPELPEPIEDGSDKDIGAMFEELDRKERVAAAEATTD